MDQDVVEEETESLWQTAKGDLTNANGLRVLGVVVVLVWMAFQWGWGNDILLPSIVARTFEAVDDSSTWPSAMLSTVAAAGAGSLFWGLTQTLDGIIVLSGLRLLPGIAARISRFLRRKGWVKSFDELSLGARFLIAYASGASILCLVDVFATGKQGLGIRRRMLAEAVALSVAGVAIIVVVVAGVSAIGRRAPATASTADTIVRFAGNPLTWLVIYGSLFGLSVLGSKIGEMGEADEH